MIPSKATRLTLGTSLGAHTTVFPVAGTEVMLFTNNITPTENTVIGDLTEATFDGYARLDAEAPPMASGIDPLTGDQRVTVNEPAGGWRWETSGVTDLPQTIYGFAVVSGGVSRGIELLAEPIVLEEADQEVNLGSVMFTIVQTPII